MQFRLNKKSVTILIVLLAGVAAGIIMGAFFAFTHDLPQIRDLESFRPHAITRIFSANKVLLAEVYLEKRDPVPLKQIPLYLRAALVATEDRKFYKHSGVDVKGIARAIIKDIMAGKFIEGSQHNYSATGQNVVSDSPKNHRAQNQRGYPGLPAGATLYQG